MDLRQLEYILAIHETQSLSKAAEKLYVSPSAISQYLAKLENEYQMPLFERNRNTWRPTRAGRIVIDASKEILRIRKNMQNEINELKENKTGFLNIGLLPGRTVQLFSAIFRQFQEKYPGIRIGLCEEATAEVLHEITEGNVDMAFLTGGRQTPNVTDQLIAREELVLVLPRRHPLSERALRAPEGDLPELDIRELKEEAFLLAWPHTKIRNLEDQLFLEAGFEPRTLLENLDLPSINMLALNGFGPAFMLRHSAYETESAVLFRPVPSRGLDIVASYRNDHYLTGAERYLIALAEQYYRT